MTPSATLRAALEHKARHYAIRFRQGIASVDLNDLEEDFYELCLEAMQQHRAEALEELEAWCDQEAEFDEKGLAKEIYLHELKAKLAALKTNQHGNI